MKNQKQSLAVDPEQISVLMVGALPPPIGGMSVSFEILVGLLSKRNDVAVTVVDISQLRYGSIAQFGAFRRSMCKLIVAARKVDVITVYCASTGLPTLGLFLLVLSWVVRKPLIIRKAAGLDYKEIGRFKGSVAGFVVRRSNMYLAQTKFLVDLAKERGISHVRWYPTSRPLFQGVSKEVSAGKCAVRFVFVGQVREYKGIVEIIEAAEVLGGEVKVDIFGPIFNDFDHRLLDNAKFVNYCGVLATDRVAAILSSYDMLLLPTKARSEGYPGAILDGYSAGLPVITTRCGGIPEIVPEDAGLFVEPGDVMGLVAVMKSVNRDSDLFARLRLGALKMRDEFNADRWASFFVDCCREVRAKRKICDEVHR